MKQLRVSVGYSRVPIYGKLYNQGQTVALSDEQYQALPTFVKQQVEVLRTYSDPSPTPPPTPDTSDQWFNTELIQQAVPIFLTWDGTQYQPARMKARLDRPKTFIGPSDPKDIAGVQLAVRDQWINY